MRPLYHQPALHGTNQQMQVFTCSLTINAPTSQRSRLLGPLSSPPLDGCGNLN
jgi:hypothetical protein